MYPLITRGTTRVAASRQRHPGDGQGGGTNTAGALTSASYTQSFDYDTLNRLTSGPLGAYTYGDSAHLHGATGIGGQWSGSYDAAGDLTCRAPSSATTHAVSLALP